MKEEDNKELKYLFFLSNRQKKIMKKLQKRNKKKKCKKNPKDEKNSAIIKLLKGKGFFKRIRSDRFGNVKLKMPHIFNFYENPEGSIETLQKLFYALIKGKTKNIFVDHSECNELGIGASAITNILVKEYRSTINKIGFSGYTSTSPYVNEMLRLTGLPKLLNIEISQDILNQNVILELIENEESGIASTKIVEYFVKSLHTQNLSLKEEGTELLSNMIGEIILNASEHGGYGTRWYALGQYNLYYDKKYGEFHLVILNFGQTIYEGLKSKETTEQIRQQLMAMTKNVNALEEEKLWTLYALQEGVSRFKSDIKSENGKYSPDRGTGTVTLIDNFQTIGKNHDNIEPIMSITSGHTHILFDGSYRLKEDINTHCKVIAFNKDNDLMKLPDNRVVRVMKQYFPGTVISMKFYIDRQYIVENIIGGK